MPLDLKFKATTSNNCTELVLQDITGAYDSETNPGGWGGFNPRGIRSNTFVKVFIKRSIPYDGDEGVPVTVNVEITDLFYDGFFPSAETYRGYKFSVPYQELQFRTVENIRTRITDKTEEKLTKLIDKLESEVTISDAIYTLTFTLMETAGNVVPEPVFIIVNFTSICNSRKKVDKLLANANLGCEDCDDADIDKALLAKSLLDSLVNIDNKLKNI